MKPQILVIAKDENTRGMMKSFFSEKGFNPIIIERNKIIPEQQIVVCEDGIRLGDTDIIKGTVAAIILDSGYMWPNPVLKPSMEIWEKYRNNLDEYLRNERESFSLWYSLLEILNESIPLCINPQEAFEAEAFKPWALEKLGDSGVSVPMMISGNDPDKIGSFIEKTPGHFLAIPLSEDDKPVWVTEYEVMLKDLNRIPVFLQSLSSRDAVHVFAVNGKPVVTNPESADISHVLEQIPKIQEILQMPFAHLIFRHSNDLVLSDFCASPDIGLFSKEEQGMIMDELWGFIEEKQ
ncbi:MAG: hypothetical protein ACMUIU_08775 [bacterium]